MCFCGKKSAGDGGDAGVFPAAGIVTVSGGMEGLCRGYRRLAGTARCGFRRQTGHLNAAGGRHRCGSSYATGAGRTAPAAGNGTEYRCTPAQGVRRGPKAVPGHFPAVRRIPAGTRRCTTAAPPAEITAGTPFFGQPRNRKPGADPVPPQGRYAPAQQ